MNVKDIKVGLVNRWMIQNKSGSEKGKSISSMMGRILPKWNEM